MVINIAIIRSLQARIVAPTILIAFKVNRTYFDHRSLEHEVGSLEAVVSKLIKNWDAWLLREDIGL